MLDRGSSYTNGRTVSLFCVAFRRREAQTFILVAVDVCWFCSSTPPTPSVSAHKNGHPFFTQMNVSLRIMIGVNYCDYTVYYFSLLANEDI